ncbi:MAG TPA: universal stress protein [Dehalococcoidia bacterium]|nr:universal stress protein [Dehalococcoidia bacterium]
MAAEAPILVPLDGSELSERALPYAVQFASALAAPVVLLAVWRHMEPRRHAGAPDDDPLRRKSAEAAESYLEGVRARYAGEARVTAMAREGEPAHEIQAACTELSARLVAMTTHGRTGLQRWRFGSVAHRVIHEGASPTLVVGPEVLRQPAVNPAIRKVLAPLDGSHFAESALPLVREIAEAFRAAVLLARIVPFAVQAYPFSPVAIGMPALDEELERGARAYLESKQGAVPGAELGVYQGHVAERICDIVEHEQFNLVVMATHARAAVGRVLLGSTADRAIQCRAPVLLVRP